MKVPTIFAVAALIIALMGCSEQVARPPSKPTTVETSVGVEPSTTSGSGSPHVAVSPESHRLGATVDRPFETLQVLDVRKGQSARSQLPIDRQWWKVDVKVCAVRPDGEKTTRSGWFPWSIVGDDGKTYEPSDRRWKDFPQPAYPTSTDMIPAGECRAGWLMFDLPSAVQPDEVVWSREEMVVWRVGR